VLEASIDALTAFKRIAGSRGRFIATYLGLRRMGDLVAPLGSSTFTPVSEIESYLDFMWTKTHRQTPRTVLTAPFGSSAQNGGYSTNSGAMAPGSSYPTNTWRNNLNVQKGVGCVAPAVEVAELVLKVEPRMACPHLTFDSQNPGYVCGINGTRYRNEMHTIWVARSDPDGGYQVVDLDLPSVYEDYLMPNGTRIPIFALIGALYSLAPNDFYPVHLSVGIPEFAADFGYDLAEVERIYNCDPSDPFNAAVLAIAGLASAEASGVPGTLVPSLPSIGDAVLLNSGLGAELAVAETLQRDGWTVAYTGNQTLLGYDLRADKGDDTLRVEVKSSIGFCTPELTQSEWDAAIEFEDHFVLAIVDFFGSEKQDIWFVRNPADGTEPTIKVSTSFRLPRAQVEPLKTDVDFL